MTVYMVAQVEILDPEQWEHYKKSLLRQSPGTAGGTWRAVPAPK